MCSTPQERIAAFGRAIEDFESRTRSDAVAAEESVGAGGSRPTERARGGGDVAAGSPPGSTEPEPRADALSRLAELWAELATLDPEVAKRLPIYEA